MNKDNVKNIYKTLLQWGPLLILIIFVIAAYLSGLYDLLSLEHIKNQKSTFLNYVHKHPNLSIFVFCFLYIGSVALSLPIATLLTLLSGFLFGVWLGTALVVLSATLGASIIFSIAKSSFGKALRQRADRLYIKIEANMQENAISFLLFMRLVPLFPFFLVNIAPALFNISFRVFFLTTLIGIIPGSFIYVNVGQTLGTIEQLEDILSKKALFSFILLGCFALLPAIYKKLKVLNNEK